MPDAASFASSSVLPPPRVPDPPMPGEAFQDRLFGLIAAICVSDGMLTFQGYQAAQQAAERVFGEQTHEAEHQAKLLYALLNPPVAPVDLARNMAKQAAERLVAASLIERLLESLLAATTILGQGDALYRDIEWAFHRAHLEEAATREGGWSSRLGFDVTDSLAGLYQMSKRLLLPSPRRPGLLASEAARFSAQAETSVGALEAVARTVGDQDLSHDVHAFRRFMVEQAYRLVVVGERKRGKSSLVNALVGRPLSPVRESVPETGTVIEFRHANAPEYSVHFLDTAQFGHLEAYLAEEEGNALLRDKIRAIREGVQSGSFVPGRLLAGVTSWDELPDYVAAGGAYTNFVAKVAVGLPLVNLRDGVVVVDTPGLNDTDQFHDYLAYEESLSADGVLFVMDARNPGSASELHLLRRLARAGRTVGVVGVLTQTDKLDDGAQSLDNARAQAWAVLREACREAPQVRIFGVAALNAREAMRLRCADTADEPSGELAHLLRLLQDMMSRDAARSEYRAKRAALLAGLVARARESVATYTTRMAAELPDPPLRRMLAAHSEQLTAATAQSLELARQVVAAAGAELDNWDRETERNLTALRDTLVLRLLEAVHQHINAAALNFSNPAIWKRFEREQARDIARQAIDAFLDEERQTLIGWESKLRLFTHELHTLAATCLERAAASSEALDSLQVQTSATTHALIQTREHMKALSIFSSGAAAGAATALTPTLFLLTAGNVLGLLAASPALMAALAVAVGTASLIRRLGNPEKRRTEFMARQRAEAEAYADRIIEVLRRELATVRADVGRAYDAELRRGFMPALESLGCQAVHIRRFLDVMDRIEHDARRYSAETRQHLQALTGHESPPAT